MAAVVYFPNPFDMTQRDIHRVEAGVTINQWLASSGYDVRIRQRPTVLILNSRELLEEEFDHVLTDSDQLVLAVLTEAPVVAFIVANWVAIAVLVISALVLPGMMEPDLPETADTPEGSPTYSLSARGNRARLGQPKPVLYGTLRIYPDLAAKAISEFDAAGDQYVYQLFELTQGTALVDESSARFEDTNLSSFDQYEMEVIPPGSSSVLFPSVVDTSAEVSNLEIGDQVVGPYSANPPSTNATRLAVDVVAAGGLFEQDKKGGLMRYSVRYKFEAREIDENGDPLGFWFELGDHTMSGDSRDPIRRTHSYSVPAGRYEVRCDRITAENDSIRISDKLSWLQLKGYIADTSVTATTRVAVRIRASEKIGNKALSKFNLVASRLLPAWSAATGWSGNVPTNSVCWAFADACRASYGGSRSDAYIDLQRLEAMAPVLDAEGVEFNGIFDTKSTLWDVLNRILMPARCRVVDRGGVYTIVRDAQQSVPVQLFTMRNIVRDSFRIEHVGVLEETADSVRIEFMDAEQDYRPAQFTAALNGGTTNSPRDVRLFGVTDKDQAHDLAQWLNAQNFYRRQLVTFETGIEGRIPFFGDLIRINHFMLGVENGKDIASGEVVAFDGVDVLTLSERVAHIASPYIVLRDLDGAPSSPWACTVIGARKVRVTDPGFDASPLQFDVDYERPHFAMGEGTDYWADVKVTKVSSVSQGKLKIEGYVDNPLVYTAAQGLPVPPISQLPNLPSIAPVISQLQAFVRGDVNDPQVYLTWHADNSDFFEVEYSTDGGASYLPAGVGRSLEQKFRHMPPAGIVHYRVAGHNLLRGSWVSIQVDTNSVAFQVPAGPANLILSESFTGATLKIQWDSDVLIHQVDFLVGGVVKLTKLVEANSYELAAADAQAAGLGRSFDVRVTAIADNGLSSTGYAELSVSNSIPAQLNNLLVLGVGSSIFVSYDWPAELDIAGVSVWVSGTQGFVPSASTLVIDQTSDPVVSVAADRGGTYYVRAAAVDVWGGEVNLSGEYQVSPQLITETEISPGSIKTPHLAANTITADKMLINQLSAIVANLGTVTAGTMKTTSGATARVEISSSGNFPFWIGAGTKSATNGLLYYDKTTGELVFKGELDIRSATTGARLEFTGPVIKVFDASNVLRVKIGDLSA